MPEQSHRGDEPCDKPVVETRFRVRFYETDQMGVVHHAAYITWFEEGRKRVPRAPLATRIRSWSARASLWRSRRLTPATIVLPCTTTKCASSSAWSSFKSRGMTFSYEVRRASDGELLVTGMTRHISVDKHGQVIRISGEIREKLLAGMGRLEAGG